MKTDATFKNTFFVAGIDSGLVKQQIKKKPEKVVFWLAYPEGTLLAWQRSVDTGQHTVQKCTSNI